MQKNNKVLKIDYEKCTGCRLCELVCAVKHDHVSNPVRSRIRIIKWESEGIYVPMSCQQCEDAPCAAACPSKAISRNEETSRVEIDYDKCIGCRTCVSVCPFGAMHFVAADHKVIKCDLCDFDPQCVRFCDVNAVTFAEPGDLGLQKGREAAKRLQAADRKASALLQAQ
jgi:anaerobic carbon-monoxide dehydrogenase iron sulfur subunit